MIDEHPDPGTDPLAGLDRHPRTQIDLWPLHDARQELLEEIVSQPGPGAPAGRTKVLLSVVGVAAALALVVGGAWAVTQDDEGGSDRDQVVAASSDEPAPSEPAPSEVTTEPEAERTKDRERGRVLRLRRNGVSIGSVASMDKCLRELRRLDVSTLEELRLRKDGPRRKDGRYVIYLAGKDARYLAVDQRCRVIRVGPRR